MVGKATESVIVISVIIPVYQAEKSIRGCVDSVKEAAAYLNSDAEFSDSIVEIILVDDGSTDGGRRICDELTDEYVITRHTKNHGVSHARNIGIELARGEYIVFIDADDTVRKEYFLDLLKKEDETGFDLIDITSKKSFDEPMSGYEYVENAVLAENTHVWGKLFKRQMLLKNKIIFPEGLAIGEDMLFLLDMALKLGDKKFAYVTKKDGYNYVENEDGAMNSEFKESYAHQLVCWQKAEELIKKSGHKFSDEIMDRLSTIQIMAAMLVAGKIACMSREAKKNADKDMVNTTLSASYDLVKHGLKGGRAYRMLDRGYKAKVSLFMSSRNLYLALYGAFKK